MKRKFYLCFTALIPLLGWGTAKDTPYYSVLGDATSKGIDTEWTVIDSNNDGSTWGYDSASDSGSKTACGAMYKYNSSNPGDDWLISPAVHMEAGKEYKVSVYVKSGFCAESLKVLMASGNTTTDLAAGNCLIDKKNFKEQLFSKNKVLVTPETTGDYYFGLYACSDKNEYNLYARAFSVALNVTTPATVSDLKVTEGEDLKIEASLSWTLPTKDDEGEALPAESKITNVYVYRDGTLIATLDGDATSFVDTEANGLTAGRHEYGVVVSIGDVKSLVTNVTSKYVGPIAPATLPFVSDFSTEDAFTSLWTILDSNNDGKTWYYVSKSSYSDACAKFNAGSGNSEDDWLISPPLNITKTGAYKITANMGGYNGTLEIKVGKSKTAEGLDVLAKDFSLSSSTASDQSAIVGIDEPGTYYVGLHAHNATYNYTTYAVNSVKVEECVVLPTQVTDLTAAASADKSLNVTVKWTNPIKNNVDKDMTTPLAKVELYRGEELIKTYTEVTPGSEAEYTDAVPASGVYTYKVLVYNENGTAEGTPMTAKTSWVGDNTQTLPYSCDFATADEFELWTVLDANKDGKTWTRYTNYVECKTGGLYDLCDDWLMTPPIDLAPGYYKFAFKMSGKACSVDLGYVTSVEDPAATFTRINKYDSFTSTVYGNIGDEIEYTVKIDEATKASFAWHQYSYTGNRSLDVAAVKISAIPIVPELATEVTVTPDESFGLSATVAWTNPSKDVVGNDLTSISKAEIYRNKELVGTVTEGLTPGETATFVDNTITANGEYTYSVEVYNENGKSETAATEVKSDWIGGGVELPFTADFSATGFLSSGWTVENVNNDTSWGDPLTWEALSGSIFYPSNTKTGDDWAISPRLQFESGDYIITVESFFNSRDIPTSGECSWDLAMSPSKDYKDMTVCETIKTTAVGSESAQTNVVKVKVENSGIKTIGLHAKEAGMVHISSLVVEKDPTSGCGATKLADGIYYSNGMITVPAETAEVMVLDAMGRTVLPVAKAESTVVVTALPAGVYVVVAKTAGKTETVKFVK